MGRRSGQVGPGPAPRSPLRAWGLAGEGQARGPSPPPGEGGPGCASGGLGVPFTVCLFVGWFSRRSSLTSFSLSPSPVPRPPPGIRTEQDFYVRLIDSMTKQVSCFFTSRRRGTLGPQHLGESRGWLLPSERAGTRTVSVRAGRGAGSRGAAFQVRMHSGICARRVGNVARRLVRRTQTLGRKAACRGGRMWAQLRLTRPGAPGGAQGVPGTWWVRSGPVVQNPKRLGLPEEAWGGGRGWGPRQLLQER